MTRSRPTSKQGEAHAGLDRPCSSPVRVGVDGLSVSQRRTGVGRYVAELLSAAARSSGGAVQFTAVLFKAGGNGEPADVSDLRAAGIRTLRPFPALEKAFYVATRLLLPVPFETVLPGQDLMFYPNYRRYATVRKPTISVIYDLSYLVAPDTVHPRFIRQLKRIAPQAIRRSDAVMTISDTVAGEIAEAYPEAAARVHVVPPGPPRGLPVRPPPDWQRRLAALGLRPGYLLHVGTLEPRKNILALVQAMQALPDRIAARHPLVLVGSRGWRDGPIRAAISAANGLVHHLEYLSDLDLRSVYQGATLLVLPSRYEGFGLPVLEAMSFGVPVVCSDIPVLREVGGGATVHFDHRHPDRIAQAVAEVVDDGDLRRSMIREGHRRAAAYSWEESARSFLGLIADLVGR